MTQSSELEGLDFCRIKKIFEKGFGFLTSLHYPENVFFHFSKINDNDKRDTLLKLKRGVVSIYFTSKKSDGKRKVDKVWLDIKDVPQSYLSSFVDRLLVELNDGRTNPFEIIDAFNQLKEIDKLSIQNYTDIVSSKKIQKNPSILLKLISVKDNLLLEKLSKILEELKNKTLTETDKKEILKLIMS